MAEEVLIAQLRADIDKFDADLKKAMQSAAKAAKNISAAFDKVDESTTDIPDKIDEVTESLNKAGKAGKEAGSGLDKGASSLKKWANRAIIGSVLAVGAAIVKLGYDGFQASQKMDAVGRQLNKLTGDSKLAAKEMAFIRAETDRLALSTVAGAEGFVRIANAAKGTAAEGQGVHLIFSALNEITAANNLTQDQYGTLLTQTTQIMSKQKAELEDLKSISEAGVPVFQLLSKSLNVKPPELFKAISAGKIGVQEVMVLMQQFRDEYGALAEEAANTIPAKFKRGFNAIKLGISDAFSGILESKELGRAFDSISSSFNLGSMFPTKSEWTNIIDRQIGELNRLAALISTIFEIIYQFIKRTWDRAFDYVKLKVNEIVGQFHEMNKNAKQMANILTGGLLFPKINDPIEDATKSVGDLKKAGDDLTKDAGNKGILAQFLGTDTKGFLDTIEKMNAGLRELAGLSPAQSYDDIDKKRLADQKKRQDKEQADEKKFRDKIVGWAKDSEKKITAETDAEIKKRQKAEEKALQEKLRAEEKYQDAINKLNQKIYNRQIADQAKVDTGVEKFNEKKLQEEQDRLDELQKTFDNLKENIQESMGNVISDAFKGQLGSVQDFADSVKNIFANLAGQITSALVVDKVLKTVLGEDFKEGKFGGKLGGILDKKIGKLDGKDVTIGNAGAGLGVILGGSAVGGGIGGAVGGKTGSIAGGAIGGAASGAIYGGAVYGPIGAAVGAVAGAIVGGLTSAIQAGAFTGKDKSTIGVQTSIAPPPDIYRDVTKRSPFGILSLFEDSNASQDLAQSALTFISETDTAIASYLNQRQRQIIEKYFQSAIPDGNLVRAESDDDAIAKAVVQRYYQTITALAGQEIATNVVGSPFSATKGSVGSIQQRANQALSLLKTIEEFKQGPITQTAAAIKGINEQFQALIDRATTLGIPIDEIAKEQQRQLTEITTIFNDDISQRILELSDPIAAEWAKLDKLQADRMKEAVDASANLTDVEKLNALEREELQKRLADSASAAGDAIESELIQRLDAFTRAGLSQFSQQLLALQDSFNELRTDMLAAGMSVAELTSAYRQQASVIRRQAVESVLGALYGITDPFKAAMLQMGAQVREFQKLADEGLIAQSTVNQFVRAASGQARYQEAVRIGGGGSSVQAQFTDMVDQFFSQGLKLSDTDKEVKQLSDQFLDLRKALLFLGVPTRRLEASYRSQVAAIRQRDRESKAVDQSNKADERNALIEERTQFFSAMRGITNPYQQALIDVNNQVREFQNLVSKGLIPKSYLAQYKQLLQGQAAVSQAQSLIGGGPRTAIEGVADSFQSFIQGANPLSQSAQQFKDLTENFRDLMDAAAVLRVSTRDLESAYYSQAETIRKESIKAIDQQLETQRSAIASIDTYIKGLKTGDELPNNLRFDAARSQFLTAARLGKIDEALSAGETYRDIARQRFGSTADFFTFRNEIETTLSSLRDREQKALEAERDRLIRQEQNQQAQVLLQRDSLFNLKQINVHASSTSQGIARLAIIAQQQAEITGRTQVLLQRLATVLRA